MVNLHTLIKQAKSTCIDKHRGKKTINENKQNIYENKIKPPPFLSVEYRNVKLEQSSIRGFPSPINRDQEGEPD